jgi:predicted CXXCH cytochrome family protein
MISILAVSLGGMASTLAARDPHLDSSLVPASCKACHRGHGAPRSPMLPAPQVVVCGACHDSQTARDRTRMQGRLSTIARPQLLSSVLAKPFVHPLNDQAFSRDEPGVVTCSSCHSPHRGTRASTLERGAAVTGGTPKRSPRSPAEMEFEMCQSCHGGTGLSTRDRLGISVRFDTRSRSFHPVEAPTAEGSPSVIPELAGKEINCTDCHGNDDPDGVRGPHGSGVRYLLRAEIVTTDGNQESARAYALCYGCHDREKVLDSSLFPEHRRHVVDVRSTCSTCHDPHGSPANRALIRFGDPPLQSTVSPSGISGELAFVSDAPGVGTCSLTCHGYDHVFTPYGTGFATADDLLTVPPSTRSERGSERTRRVRPGSRRREE